MSNIFQNISLRRPRTSKFDLSHERKMSMQMGDLIPTLIQEVVPGDKFTVNAEIFLRFAPLLAPIMHRVNVKTEYFFVPNRIVWDNWEDFITGGTDGLATPPFPFFTLQNSNKAFWEKGRLGDYFGIPPIDPAFTVTNNQGVSGLAFRGYQMIYNEYYRDQTLNAEVTFATGDDADSDMDQLTRVRVRSWEKDYYTSALPWAQRGGDVTLPIDSEFTPQYKATETTKFTGGLLPAGDLTQDGVDDFTRVGGFTVKVDNLVDPQQIDSTTVTINDLRRSVRLQEWLEKNARGGARYIEQILSHFGVISSDARLQRPEFLGGGKNAVQISEVLNTAGETGAGSGDLQPVGEMSGHGIATGSHNGFSKRFEEHGYIIGIMSVIPRTTYQQGIARKFTKFDKFDYYWPEFAQIGEQEISQREVFVDWEGLSGAGAVTFGYAPRYAEYKYAESTVHGDFRDDLDFWHMGRIFSTIAQPTLNGVFVRASPTQRIFAVTDPTIDKLYVQIYNRVKAIRPMSYHSDPTL